jgi:energy-coupling factor transporter ATP-binding protein EcfA2
MGICASEKDKEIADKEDFKCKYEKEELNKKLKDFINRKNIQDLDNEQKGKLNDSVYELIKKEENEELINFFDKIQESFIQDINDYLYSSENINFYPLVSQIISNEDGKNIFKNKIKKHLSEINENEEKFKINYLTILLTGKSGNGKSTLINVLLKLKKSERARTGVGNYVTTETKPYKSKNRSYLRLVDTRGIELSANYGPDKVDKECKIFINKQIQTNDINNFVHCIWYCITGNRLEECEITLLNSLRNSYQNNKIPLIMVYTQSTDNSVIKQMKDYIKEKNIEGDFIDILALPKENRGIKMPSYGIDKLVAKTIKKVKEALNGDLRNVMTSNIANNIKETLFEENKNIKNKINEETILKLIDQNKVLKEEELQNTIINIFGKNINYFFGRNDLDKKTLVDFKNSTLFKNKDNYFKYTQKLEENIIENELSSLAYKFLDIQAKKEKLKGKATNSKNKRCHEDFINTNKKFLIDNLDYIAQKSYYNYIISNSCKQLTEVFEQNLNSTISNLLNKEDIQELINKSFINKFEQFEKRIESKEPKISQASEHIEDDDDYLISNTISKFQSNVDNANIDSKFSDSEFEKKFKELPSFSTKFD